MNDTVELVRMIRTIVTDILMPIVAYILMAIAARVRGYSFFFWLLLCVGAGPAVALFALAALPNRAIHKRRRHEAALLQKQLTQAWRSAPLAGAPMPLGSLGEAPTLR